MTAIVDRHARDQAAQILRDFISGKVTNWDFMDSAPGSNDPAIFQVWNAMWYFFSDHVKYRLKGKHRLAPFERREALRFILFLDSDAPYEWPGRANPWAALLNDKQGSLAKILRRPHRSFHAAGDIGAWPFARRGDMKQALKKPKRLRGAHV